MHDQAAAYVLNALDADEAQAFERHVQLCPGCKEDLEPLRFAAAALAFAGELPPPRSALRRRVLGVDAVVLRFRRRWTAPLASAAALAACAALVVGLTDGRRQPAGVAFNLPAAPAGKVYEIWFVRQRACSPRRPGPRRANARGTRPSRGRGRRHARACRRLAQADRTATR